MPSDAKARAVASGQDGVITRQQLVIAGLTRHEIHTRARRGDLVRLHRGVYLIGGAALTFRARVRAALLCCGPTAFASHRTAAVLWRIRRGLPEVIDITVVGGAPRAPAGARIHRLGELPARQVRLREGIRLSSPARTICELAAGGEARTEVEHAIQEAAASLRLTPDELGFAAERWAGRPGAPLLRSILQDEAGNEFTRSWAERRLRRIIRAAGLPQPVMNRVLHGHRCDAVWPEQRLIVEVDGIATHGTRVAFAADRRMGVELTLAGWRVLRFTARQLHDEPLRVAAQLAVALRLTGAGADDYHPAL